MNTDISASRSYSFFKPGFLLGPLGWLNERLSVSRVPDPNLLSLLFGLEPHAMHMLGIAIAHGCDHTLLTTLFRQAPRTIVEQSIGFWPEGLDRLVRALPATALSLRTIPGDPNSPVGSDDGEISAASKGDRRLDDQRPVLIATDPAPADDFQTIWQGRGDGPVRRRIEIFEHPRGPPSGGN